MVRIWIFHTKTVEGLWSYIKRLRSNFSGLSLNSQLENKDIQSKDYIDDWLCYCLFMKEIERKNLNEYNARDN